MFRKIGVILSHTERSQAAYTLIRNINRLVVTNSDISPIIFTEEVTRCCMIPSCPILNMADIWGFDGTVVATNLNNIQTLINSPGPSKKVFYVWDLEWLRLMNYPIMYSDLYNIFSNPKITVVPRSTSHQAILQNNFNIKTHQPILDFDLDALSLC